MEHTWELSAPDGPHVGPINLDIREAVGDANNDNSVEKNKTKNMHMFYETVRIAGVGRR